MKAVFNPKYGSPDVFEIREVPVPIPKENEVLIKLKAAALNSWDWDYLRGKPYIFRLLFGLFKPKHKILGADIAGIIETVGKNVKQLKSGDEVYGDVSNNNWGGYAEYVCAPANMVAHKPKNLSFEEAAAIPQAGVLALQSLRYFGTVNPGQKILFNGAGGGVGTFGIQLAKMAGAEVTAVDTGIKLDMLKEIGADFVIEHPKEDFTQNGKQYDAIIDVVAWKTVGDYKRSLKPGGVFVLIGGNMAMAFRLATTVSWLKRKDQKKLGVLAHEPNSKDLDTLTELCEAELLKPLVDKVFPLLKTADAFRYYGSGAVQGKVVVSIED